MNDPFGFASVWTPATVVAAVVGGILVGVFIIGPILADPIYVASTATTAMLTKITIFAGVASNAVFWFGQLLASYSGGDDAWPRILGRAFIQLVFVLFIGAGTWFKVRRSISIRKARARAIAERQIGV